MITSVDTSVVLDVLIGDPKFGSLSETALRKGQGEGKLIICECVIAEVFPALDDAECFKEFLADWHLEFFPHELRERHAGGQILLGVPFARGKIKRAVPDFLIGAHAEAAADRLLARDRGYLRDYFQSLEIWDPTQT